MNNIHPDHPHRSLALYSCGLASLFVVAALSAQTSPEIAFPAHYELWRDMMQSVHKNYLAPTTAAEAAARDTDGDGKSDLVEAVLFTDPMAADRPLTPEETAVELERLARQEAASAAMREAEYAAARALLAPWHHEAMTTPDGRPFSLAAESDAKRAALAQRLPQMRENATRRKAEGLRLARQLGLGETFTYGNGKKARLVGISGGQPKYHGELNLPEARTVSAHRLWPASVGGTGTGSTGLNLTGNPSLPGLPRVRLGLWEVYHVNQAHEEFKTGRLTAIETGDLSEHANAVAAMLIARGAVANARGVAYAAEAYSRNIQDDAIELGQIFTIEPANERFFVSNHSYAGFYGWGDIDDSGGSSITCYKRTDPVGSYFTLNGFPAANRPIWRGELHPIILQKTANTSYALNDSELEDHDFGFYTKEESEAVDRVVYASDKLLPVWGAGNDRGDPHIGENFVHSGVNYGPGWHLETHYINGIPTKVWTNVIRQADGGVTGYDSMTPEGVAKNVLTVGAMNDQANGYPSTPAPAIEDYSNFGPTDDWRIKPDVVASGNSVYSATETGYKTYSPGGTSLAAPAVTGLLGLFVELFQRYHGADFQPPASLLKGLMIHTADDLGTSGPDFKYGWGLPNGVRAAALLHPLEADLNDPHARMVLVKTGVTLYFSVKALGGQPLKVTIVWTDPPAIAMDPLGDPQEGTYPFIDQDKKALVNDVDLRLSSGSTNWYPWMFTPSNIDSPGANPLPTTGRNSRDNVEQVIVPTAQLTAGQSFTICLHPYNTMQGDWTEQWDQAQQKYVKTRQPASQPVALLISGAQQAATPEFRIQSISRTSSTQVTLKWPATIGSVYQVQSSGNLATGGWVNVGGEIHALDTTISHPVTASPSQPQRFYRVVKTI